ncbi:MAG: YncE family protein [Blastocatellales bacterium]
MKTAALVRSLVILSALLISSISIASINSPPSAATIFKSNERHFLYVATPGIRNYLEYGGHGLLVFDIDDGHRLIKRIKTSGFDREGKPLNVKGIVANAKTNRVYISTTETLQCIDLLTEKILWEKGYEGGTDRMAIDPAGKFIYLPSLEKDHWHVVDAATGEIIKKLIPKSGAHNTVIGLDGKWAYLAGLKSPILNIADTSKHEITKTVGPFSNVIRPFTINGSQTLAYVNVNDLLGFEIGDIRTGKMLHRVEVSGFQKGPVKRHGCPSHGIGLTPDEKEVWVADAHNQRVHVFDNTVMPPRQIASLEVRDQPGWVTFSLDGKLAYPSTGEVFDVKTKKIITTLKDENGGEVHSEKMLEIDFKDGKPIRTGDQFGLGRKTR